MAGIENNEPALDRGFQKRTSGDVIETVRSAEPIDPMLRDIVTPLAIVAGIAVLGAGYSSAHRFGGEDYEGAAVMLLALVIVPGCTLRALVVAFRAERLGRSGAMQITSLLRAAMLATYVLAMTVGVVIALMLGLGQVLQ